MVSDALAPWAEPVLLTEQDLASLPDDGWRYELVQGRLVRMPPVGYGHGRVFRRLDRALDRFVEEHGLGVVTPPDVGYIVSAPGDPVTILVPDIAFISRDRTPPDDLTGFPRLAPDLVVEIASPSRHQPEMAAKANLWLAAGTGLVWVIWPQERQVEVWEAGEAEPRRAGEALEGGKVLPGFCFPLRELFQGESTGR